MKEVVGSGDAQSAFVLLQFIRQQRHKRIDGIDVRGRGFGDPAKFHDRADQSVEFERAAELHILQHGGLVLAHCLRAIDAFFQAHLELDAQFLADDLRFPHHVGGQFTGGGEHADIFQGGMRQRTDRVEAQVAP